MQKRAVAVPQPDFQTLFEAVPGCYLVLLPDFTIVAASDAYLKATLTRREHILGRGLFEVFPDNPDDPTATGTRNLRASLNKVLKNKAPDTMAVQKYDIRQSQSTGGGFEERYWSPINSPVLNAAHEVTYIVHRVEDVTEFVHLKQHIKHDKTTEELKTRAEQMEAEILQRVRELQDANKKLTDNQLFLDSVVENLPNMVFVKEAEDLRFVLFNKAGEDLLGYARADLIGKNDYDFFPKDQADFFVEKDHNVLIQGQLLNIPEEPIQTRHHGVRFLHTKKIPIKDSAGKATYLLGISEDITEQKIAEEEIRTLNRKLGQYVRELQTINKELESFSYSVSHDLRAPLRSMSGFSQILLAEYDQLTEAERNDYLQRISNAAIKMGKLIDGLLDLGRLSRQPLHREPVDLSALARTIAGNLKATHPGSSVTVVIPDQLVVEGDASLLHVVVQNLMGNAWKFSAGIANPRIEIGGFRDAGGVMTYFVRDNGAGFNMEYKDKLFGPFQRLHSDKEFAGTGIGLATVQRIVHRHGGRAWGESEIGKGATFYFTLA